MTNHKIDTLAREALGVIQAGEVPADKPEFLECVCCGYGCWGRQHTSAKLYEGFGLCADCFPHIFYRYFIDYDEDCAVAFIRDYGRDGVNFYSEPNKSQGYFDE